MFLALTDAPREVSMRLCLISTLFFCAIAAVAQTPVDGVLRDGAGVPLSKVEIELQRPDSPVQEKANTDAEGRFYF